ncbi:cation diffusion facilitator family transporter [Aliifodinibius sp. S!AR15-10]|uniref:cation diffusion facilitator family transporter n=1 Tax=Aliifodinibius sp. S!AR15-10 TaxID=2950437 RepID=UPI0028630171|nr:cation diffusion facilitator family transporter [Aliifodinibius sp. S!AR15-10]MDR8390964.1 cation diffusion facilitator family transporter [Aliifodinibius sp. S!AR15-10]
MASSSKKVIYAALIGNALIAVTKFIASVTTGSSAMLSEGIHSLVDTGNQLLLLLGLKRAKMPADEEFPFGHGKEVYFWSFVVAIMIFAVGAGISLYEGIHSLMDPHPVQDPYINYIVLGLAMVFEGGAWYFAWKEFNAMRDSRGYFEAVRKEKDPTTFVVLFEDTAAMLGLIVAFVGIGLGQYTGNPAWDGIASIVIGLILGLTAAWLAYETKGLLIGESADKEIVRQIRSMADDFKEIKRVNETLTMHMGPNFILVNISVDYMDGLDSQRVEESISRLNRQIKEQFPRVKRVFVEAQALSDRQT